MLHLSINLSPPSCQGLFCTSDIRLLTSVSGVLDEPLTQPCNCQHELHAIANVPQMSSIAKHTLVSLPMCLYTPFDCKGSLYLPDMYFLKDVWKICVWRGCYIKDISCFSIEFGGFTWPGPYFDGVHFPLRLPQQAILLAHCLSTYVLVHW